MLYKKILLFQFIDLKMSRLINCVLYNGLWNLPAISKWKLLLHTEINYIVIIWKCNSILKK